MESEELKYIEAGSRMVMTRGREVKEMGNVGQRADSCSNIGLEI